MTTQILWTASDIQRKCFRWQTSDLLLWKRDINSWNNIFFNLYRFCDHYMAKTRSYDLNKVINQASKWKPRYKFGFSIICVCSIWEFLNLLHFERHTQEPQTMDAITKILKNCYNSFNFDLMSVKPKHINIGPPALCYMSVKGMTSHVTW